MIKKAVYTKKPTAGVVSWNSDDDMRGVIQHLCINPSATDTTYDVTMTDDTGSIAYQSLGNTGTLRDDTKVGLYGIYTFNVSNTSTSDNTFTIRIIWDDSFLG